LSEDKVRELIHENTDGRDLGMFGDPGANVLQLNLALDQQH
jgi:K+-transporting ATPase ATPase C chain